MKIDHIAIWTTDLEAMRQFYTKYFGAQANEIYRNVAKNYSSYFLCFDTSCRIELMHKPEIAALTEKPDQFIGITHFAINVGSKAVVDSLTALLRNDGYHILSEPRTTGDGYYESVVADPEGNRVEIVA